MENLIAKAIDVGEQFGWWIDMDLHRTHALHSVLPGVGSSLMLPHWEERLGRPVLDYIAHGPAKVRREIIDLGAALNAAIC
jgi:hypothetical protein